MNYVFDLDGTLFDTKKAVFEAYKEAGVEMPDNAWGKPWYEWLEDKAIRERKKKLYPKFVKQYAKPLPLLTLFLHLQKTHRVCTILTGASEEATWDLIDTQIGFIVSSMHFELTPEHKISILSDMNPGIYFDDNLEIVTMMKERLPEWQIVKV